MAETTYPLDSAELVDAYRRAYAVQLRVDVREESDDVTDAEAEILAAPATILGKLAYEACGNVDISTISRAAIASVIWPEPSISTPRHFVGFPQMLSRVNERERTLKSIDDSLRMSDTPVLVVRSNVTDIEADDSQRYLYASGTGRGLRIDSTTDDTSHHVTATIGLSDVHARSLWLPNGVYIDQGDSKEGLVCVGIPELTFAEEHGTRLYANRLFYPGAERGPAPATQCYFIGEEPVARFVLGAKDASVRQRSPMAWKAIAADILLSGGPLSMPRP